MALRPLGIAVWELSSFAYLEKRIGLSGILHRFIWLFTIAAVTYYALSLGAHTGIQRLAMWLGLALTMAGDYRNYLAKLSKFA